MESNLSLHFIFKELLSLTKESTKETIFVFKGKIYRISSKIFAYAYIKFDTIENMLDMHLNSLAS